jgi:hypothetical protein
MLNSQYSNGDGGWVNNDPRKIDVDIISKLPLRKINPEKYKDEIRNAQAFISNTITKIKDLIDAQDATI